MAGVKFRSNMYLCVVNVNGGSSTITAEVRPFQRQPLEFPIDIPNQSHHRDSSSLACQFAIRQGFRARRRQAGSVPQHLRDPIHTSPQSRPLISPRPGSAPLDQLVLMVTNKFYTRVCTSQFFGQTRSGSDHGEVSSQVPRQPRAVRI